MSSANARAELERMREIARRGGPVMGGREIPGGTVYDSRYGPILEANRKRVPWTGPTDEIQAVTWYDEEE